MVHQEARHERFPERCSPLSLRRRVRPARADTGADPADDPGAFRHGAAHTSYHQPHIVVSHSMGTVIAYDCLKRVADCAGVDGLITLGSPLGLDEIQDKLQPGWSADDGFPHEKVGAEWINVYDRLDPVCGFDPELANDFQKGSSADRSRTSRCRTRGPGGTRSRSISASRKSSGRCAGC